MGRNRASDSMASSDGKIIITRWMDNRAVNSASNFLTDDEDDVPRWNKTDCAHIKVKHPTVVQKYNRCMGGVDKTNFLISLYQMFIRCRKWAL